MTAAPNRHENKHVEPTNCHHRHRCCCCCSSRHCCYYVSVFIYLRLWSCSWARLSADHSRLQTTKLTFMMCLQHRSFIHSRVFSVFIASEFVASRSCCCCCLFIYYWWLVCLFSLVVCIVWRCSGRNLFIFEKSFIFLRSLIYKHMHKETRMSFCFCFVIAGRCGPERFILLMWHNLNMRILHKMQIGRT